MFARCDICWFTDVPPRKSSERLPPRPAPAYRHLSLLHPLRLGSVSLAAAVESVADASAPTAAVACHRFLLRQSLIVLILLLQETLALPSPDAQLAFAAVSGTSGAVRLIEHRPSCCCWRCALSAQSLWPGGGGPEELAG
jgi:hypothetical protein